MPPIGRAESASCSKRRNAVSPMGIMSAPVTRAAFFRHRVAVTLFTSARADHPAQRRSAYAAWRLRSVPGSFLQCLGHLYFHSLYARNGRKQIFAVVRTSFAKNAFGSGGTSFPSPLNSQRNPLSTKKAGSRPRPAHTPSGYCSEGRFQRDWAQGVGSSSPGASTARKQLGLTDPTSQLFSQSFLSFGFAVRLADDMAESLTRRVNAVRCSGHVHAPSCRVAACIVRAGLPPKVVDATQLHLRLRPGLMYNTFT